MQIISQAREQTKTSIAPSNLLLQRSCSDCPKKRKLLQRRSVIRARHEEVPPIVHEVIRSPGRPLDRETKEFMESRFLHDFSRVRSHAALQSAGLTIGPADDIYEGEAKSAADSVMHPISSQEPQGKKYDFSHVRVHDDTMAADSARAISASAYAVGNDIVFGKGQYSPRATEGQRLLAHELTHVVQQGDMVHAIQRLTREEKEQDLRSDRLKNDSRLQEAFDNDPSMKIGEKSEGVKTLQRALKDLGYPMPISFQKTGDADGIFGSETKETVLQFQTDHSLMYKDGIAGRETLQALDQMFLGVQEPCKIRYIGGVLNPQERITFIQNNFAPADRPEAKKVLDDLCEVTGNVMSFESEEELKNEVLKRFKVSQYLRESQAVGAFGYPESARNCTGKTGNSLADAQVNIDAKEYWNGPILEQRSFIRNKHYYFELSDPKGKENAYQSLKLLFVPHNNICDRTLIHCDTLITLAETLAYADTIGEKQFNEKIRSGQLSMWLTFDGMSIRETETGNTPVSISYQKIVPSSKQDLVIGDHVTFWNHLAYDAISSKNPGPWRLENAVLVDRDVSGQDMFEGHGAPLLEGTIKPGTELNMLNELIKVYNSYAMDALSISDRVDHNVSGAEDEMRNRYPQVKKFGDTWWIEELDRNRDRPQHFYILRQITDPFDPELIGLRDPYHPTQMNYVERPVESR